MPTPLIIVCTYIDQQTHSFVPIAHILPSLSGWLLSAHSAAAFPLCSDFPPTRYGFTITVLQEHTGRRAGNGHGGGENTAQTG